MLKDGVSLPLPRTMRSKVPLSRPLRHSRYRQLWMANLVSNLGTWTQTFAAAWLIAKASTLASTSSLIQTATYAPIFLFALFAGVLADTVNRPKFLFLCNLFMAVCACLMALLAMYGMATPGRVLFLTFCMGTGSAFMWPAWQASMSGLVEPAEVEAAATLNNLSYNVAAIAGPALGGLLFAVIGAGWLFLVNAISFIGLLGVYWFWWREQGQAPQRTGMGFRHSFTSGMATAFGCARYRHILLNVCTVFFATIAFAALLPVFVKDVLHLKSKVFGLMMGSLGVGAVLGALLLPTIRQHIGKTRLLAGSLFVYGLMLVSLAFLRSLAVLIPSIMLAGMAWSATVSTLNAAAQLSFPAEIRARTLSIYLFVMAGGYTVGSLVWGRVADYAGVETALGLAGLCVMLNAFLLISGKRETSI